MDNTRQKLEKLLGELQAKETLKAIKDSDASKIELEFGDFEELFYEWWNEGEPN